MILLYRYRLKARYYKSGEKSRHFGYPDYFTYPVCQDQPCGQRSPDNRGWTVVVDLLSLYTNYYSHSCSFTMSQYYTLFVVQRPLFIPHEVSLSVCTIFDPHLLAEVQLVTVHPYSYSCVDPASRGSKVHRMGP